MNIEELRNQSKDKIQQLQNGLDRLVYSTAAIMFTTSFLPWISGKGFGTALQLFAGILLEQQLERFRANIDRKLIANELKRSNDILLGQEPIVLEGRGPQLIVMGGGAHQLVTNLIENCTHPVVPIMKGNGQANEILASQTQRGLHIDAGYINLDPHQSGSVMDIIENGLADLLPLGEENLVTTDLFEEGIDVRPRLFTVSVQSNLHDVLTRNWDGVGADLASSEIVHHSISKELLKSGKISADDSVHLRFATAFEPKETLGNHVGNGGSKNPIVPIRNLRNPIPFTTTYDQDSAYLSETLHTVWVDPWCQALSAIRKVMTKDGVDGNIGIEIISDSVDTGKLPFLKAFNFTSTTTFTEFRGYDEKRRAQVYTESTDEKVIHQLLSHRKPGDTEICIAIVNTPESASFISKNIKGVIPLSLIGMQINMVEEVIQYVRAGHKASDIQYLIDLSLNYDGCMREFVSNIQN